MSNNLGNSSFVNLFPSFVYDKDQVAEKSLDIWNTYRIKILNTNKNDTAFVFHQLRESDNFVRLALEYYNDSKLWWLIPLSNDAEDPFTYLDDLRREPQPIIRILKGQFVGNLIFEITNAREKAQSIYTKNGESF